MAAGTVVEPIGFVVPPTLSIDDITYSVCRGGCGVADHKPILSGISFTAVGGRMLAIMGGSGAGKTSLLDVLTWRAQQWGKVSGTVTLNSELFTRRCFLNHGVRVSQEPLLWGQLTTRETLQYCAALYRPGLSIAVQAASVNEVLDSFGLESCANVRVGSLWLKGLSGGQKHRLCIAEALMKRPAVMILDEPTSGLDSTAAYEVSRVLQSVARSHNLVVLCTIHQPSHRTYSLFDDCMILARGRVAYCGVRDAALEYISRFDVPAMLPGMSVAEYLLEITNFDFTEPQKVEVLLDAWRPEFSGAPSTATLRRNPACPWSKQFSVLTRRLAMMLLRDPTLYSARWLFALICNAFIAWFYMDVASRAQEQIVPRMFLIAWVIAAPAFMSVIIVAVYMMDFHTLSKELANGMYRKSAYVASSVVLMVPACFALSSFAILPYALIAGCPWAALPTMVVAHATCMFWAESLAELLAVSTPHALVGMAAYMCVMFLSLMQAGLVISIGSIPSVLRWIHYGNPLLLALRAIVTVEFKESAFDGFGIAGELCQSPPAQCFGRNGDQVLDAVSCIFSSFGSDYDPWVDIATSAAVALTFKVGHFIIIELKRF